MTMEKLNKGNATIIMEVRKVSWEELETLVEFLKKNPLTVIVEVHIGKEVFDA